MDNALSLIQSWINESENKVTIIPRISHENLCEEVLGVSEHSVLGTLINHVGGFSVNNLVRHFGGDNSFELSIKEVNAISEKRPTRIKYALIIADDVYGGLFAINAGISSIKIGNVIYLPPDIYPDIYAWEDLEVGHSHFVRWCIGGDLNLFYKKFLQRYSTQITCGYDECLDFIPSLWINADNRKVGKIKSGKNCIIKSQYLDLLS